MEGKLERPLTPVFTRFDVCASILPLMSPKYRSCTTETRYINPHSETAPTHEHVPCQENSVERTQPPAQHLHDVNDVTANMPQSNTDIPYDTSQAETSETNIHA